MFVLYMDSITRYKICVMCTKFDIYFCITTKYEYTPN